MPPATITETMTRRGVSATISCKEINLIPKSNQSEIPDKSLEIRAEKAEKQHKICPYDATRPSNEPRFMGKIRDWEKRVGFVTSLRWINVIFISLFHITTVVSFLWLLCLGYLPKWQTVFFGYVIGNLAGFGVTAGVHRFWCHRSYKARLPLQIILMLCYSVAGQNNIYHWVRDHRVHHKFSETAADPHDARRGFFFSHVGWLMMRKHPDVIREGAKIDMSDIANDPLVQFHTKYFTVLKLLCCFVLPTVVPVMWWGESWVFSVQSQALLRYMFSLNFTWAVNSFAHMWGNKPYDRHIRPVENWGVSVVAMGEGWHNYHHTFPWDYKAAELAYTLNVTTLLLDLFAKIGWAYDLKEASPSLVRAVSRNRGDRRSPN